MAGESTGSGKDQGGLAIYADFIRSELDATRDASARLDQRSAFIVTTSGALVSLVFGFTTILRRGSELHVTSGSRAALYVALACFSAAALLAIGAFVPVLGIHATTDSLRQAVVDYSDDSERDAQVRVSATLINYVDDVRRANGLRSFLVGFGLTAEMLAVLSTALAVALLIHSD